MPCYSPLEGFRSKTLSRNGKRPIVFTAADGYVDLPITVPCGRCIGCRLEYSRQWAVRCVHEASLHQDNSYITLTYNKENLPDDKSINKRALQLFFKRLRKKLAPRQIRYFACGEYGDLNNRPHYHAIIFGYRPPDLELHKVENGFPLYKSQEVRDAWADQGNVLVGEVTFESCAYVARYVTKKFRTKDDEEHARHYGMLNTDTGEYHSLEPEFCLCSRRPGIGKGWYEQFKSDTDKDFITLRGVKMSLPKYYDSLLEKEDEEALQTKKKARKKRAKDLADDNTPERLRVKEHVKKAQVKQLKRSIEEIGP